MTEQWVTIQDAAKAVGRNKYAISRLVKHGVLTTKVNPVDNRMKLVNLAQVKELYSTRSTIQNDTEHKAKE